MNVVQAQGFEVALRAAANCAGWSWLSCWGMRA